jgi:hypothetical protein
MKYLVALAVLVMLSGCAGDPVTVTYQMSGTSSDSFNISYVNGPDGAGLDTTGSIPWTMTVTLTSGDTFFLSVAPSSGAMSGSVTVTAYAGGAVLATSSGSYVGASVAGTVP